VQKDRGQGMKILVVEDDKFRHEWFREIMRKHDLHIVKTVADALQMDLHAFDEIWLDHDLGINAGSGMDVAEYLVEGVKFMGDPATARIYIHSCNTPAAIMMKKKLDIAFNEVYVMPFLYMVGHTREYMEEYDGKA